MPDDAFPPTGPHAYWLDELQHLTVPGRDAFLFVPADIVSTGVLPARAWQDSAGTWTVLLSEAIADLTNHHTITIKETRSCASSSSAATPTTRASAPKRRSST